MTDPREARPPHDRALLEPWALDLLDRESESDPAAREELSRVVALLRSLPDPEPPEHLLERILARTAAEPRRPGIRLATAWDRARRAIPPAPIALAMAAGVAGLIALTPVQMGIQSLFGAGEAPPTAQTAFLEIPKTPETPERTTSIGTRRTGVVRPHFVSVFAQTVFAQMPSAAPQIRFDRTPSEEAFSRGLDRQLNQLMMNPTLFAMRLQRMPQREQFIDRLAERAAQRGDAPEIALRVRQSDHPLAPQLVDQLLGATLMANVSPR